MAFLRHQGRDCHLLLSVVIVNESNLKNSCRIASLARSYAKQGVFVFEYLPHRNETTSIPGMDHRHVRSCVRYEVDGCGCAVIGEPDHQREHGPRGVLPGMRLEMATDHKTMGSIKAWSNRAN